MQKINKKPKGKKFRNYANSTSHNNHSTINTCRSSNININRRQWNINKSSTFNRRTITHNGKRGYEFRVEYISN